MRRAATSFASPMRAIRAYASVSVLAAHSTDGCAVFNAHSVPGAVPRRVRVARQLGLMPPAGGGVQGSPVKINLAPAALTQIAA